MNWAVYLLGMLISNKRHEIPSSILLKNESDLDKLIASGQSAVIDEIYAAFEKAKSY